MLKIKRVRLPTRTEYDLLATIAKEDDDLMHWYGMHSLCQDKGPNMASSRMVCGGVSAHFWNEIHATSRDERAGFRPVFEILDGGFFDFLYYGDLVPDGTIVTAGTLYINGVPVKVPQNPVWNGDIPDYMPLAKLEFREALGDPAYQVKAIGVGNILIADRVLIKNISWLDLDKQGVC